MTSGRAFDALRLAARVCADPAGAVRRWRIHSGRKAIGCFPVFVPEEALSAAAMLPVAVWGDEYPQVDAGHPDPSPCPAIRGVFSSIRKGSWDIIDAWAFPSPCLKNPDPPGFPDEMAGGRPLFTLAVPDPRDPGGKLERALDGVEALCEWAGQVSGRLVTEGTLDKAVREYNVNRRRFDSLAQKMAESPGCLSATEYMSVCRSGMMLPRAAHTMILDAVLDRGKTTGRAPRARVFLAGTAATNDLLETLDASGASVVGDDLVIGRRYYATLSEEGGDGALSLARRLLKESDRCGMTADGHEGGRGIASRAAMCGADRILFLSVPGCGCGGRDHAGPETGIMGRGIAFLALETGIGGRLEEEKKKRIEAFLDG